MRIEVRRYFPEIRTETGEIERVPVKVRKMFWEVDGVEYRLTLTVRKTGNRYSVHRLGRAKKYAEFWTAKEEADIMSRWYKIGTFSRRDVLVLVPVTARMLSELEDS